MSKSRILVTALTCLALAAGSAPALADPGGGNGKDQGNWKGNSQGGKGNEGQGKQGHQGKSQGNQGNQGKSQGNQGNQGYMTGDSDWRHGPSIDRGSIIGVLGGIGTTGVQARPYRQAYKKTWRGASHCHLA